MSAEDLQRQRLSAVPLLLLGAVDLVVALFLLLDSRFSVAFLAIFTLGLVLVGVGFYKLHRAIPAAPE